MVDKASTDTNRMTADACLEVMEATVIDSNQTSSGCPKNGVPSVGDGGSMARTTRVFAGAGVGRGRSCFELDNLISPNKSLQDVHPSGRIQQLLELKLVHHDQEGGCAGFKERFPMSLLFHCGRTTRGRTRFDSPAIPWHAVALRRIERN
jgi:hypothetical protein